MLDRTRPQQRKFKRIVGRQLARLLEAGGAATPTAADDADERRRSRRPEPVPCPSGRRRARGAPRLRPVRPRSGVAGGAQAPSGVRAGRRGAADDQFDGEVARRRACGRPGRPAGPACRVRRTARRAGGRWSVRGRRRVARARSSKPVTEMSSGTRRPRRRAALQAPAARMSSSQTRAVGRGPGAVRAVLGRAGRRSTRAGARRCAAAAPGTAAARAASAPARTSKVQESTSAARWTKRRWPRPSRWSGDLAHAVGDVEVDGGRAPGARRGRCPASPGAAAPPRDARPSASAAIEEAMTPSRAARAEAKGSRAGPMPSGEG